MPNSQFEHQIRRTIDAFVNELSGLVREAALSSVSEAFGGAAAPGRKARGHAAPGRRVTGPGRRRKGAKRDPADLTRLTAHLLAAIKAKPNRRMEEIGKELGKSTRELALPAKKLIRARSVRTKGQRRATRYSPA